MIQPSDADRPRPGATLWGTTWSPAPSSAWPRSTLMVGWAVLGMHLHAPGTTLFFLFVNSLAFSALGSIVGLLAERWGDVANCQKCLITPLGFLGDVFYYSRMLSDNLARRQPAQSHLLPRERLPDVSPMVSAAAGLALFARGYELRVRRRAEEGARDRHGIDNVRGRVNRGVVGSNPTWGAS
jgi:hypothetical protein